MLIGAINRIERDETPPALPSNGDASRFRGPVAIDLIAPADDWDTCWKARDLERRETSPWASDPW